MKRRYKFKREGMGIWDENLGHSCISPTRSLIVLKGDRGAAKLLRQITKLLNEDEQDRIDRRDRAQVRARENRRSKKIWRIRLRVKGSWAWGYVTWVNPRYRRHERWGTADKLSQGKLYTREEAEKIVTKYWDLWRDVGGVKAVQLVVSKYGDAASLSFSYKVVRGKKLHLSRRLVL